jgi:RNA polymerase sigma-70 factor (ECF subfamily)
VARVLDGDRDAARELYDAHVRRVFSIAYRFAGDEERARDLVQEAFIRVFAQLSGFRGDAALSTWIYRVALTVFANVQRRERRHTREVAIELADMVVDERRPQADPDLTQRLHEAINALPEIYRVTVVMYDIEGFSHQDIAEATGVAVGTSKSRLSLARAQLRATLAPFMKE